MFKSIITAIALTVTTTAAFAAAPTIKNTAEGVFVDSCALDLCGGQHFDGSVEEVVAMVRELAASNGVELTNQNNQTSVSLVTVERHVEELDMASLITDVATRIFDQGGDFSIDAYNAAFNEVHTVLNDITVFVATVEGFSQNNSNLTNADRTYLSAVTFNALCLEAAAGDMPTLGRTIVLFGEALEAL